jgi:hypothetical protein
VKRRLAAWLRRHADRIDPDGAPRRTSWYFTQEDGWGTVFNQDGRGCPLYYYGLADYALAHTGAVQPPGPADTKWVTFGSGVPGMVHVLGSAEVASVTTTRRMVGYDEVPVPARTARHRQPKPATAKVPRWRVTLTVELDSFISLPGRTYEDAIRSMFGRAGTTG